MSTKEPWNRAGLQQFLGPVRPLPPRVPIGAPPEGPTRSLAVVVPSEEHETARLQAGCTRDRAGSRRPYDDPKRGCLSVDRNLVDDLAKRGGHHDVRGFHGPSLVAVVGPPDVRDECALLDAQE